MAKSHVEIDISKLPLRIFPDINEASDEGLLAQGGDLSPEILLSAYLQGIFPWFNENDPILWWSPNPRMIVYPKQYHADKEVLRLIRNRRFTVEFDKDFEAVIKNCAASKRKGQKGTWITNAMKDAYLELHRMGYAHSVEVYLGGRLVGGLYGLTLGKVFCGESMFYKISNASKVAFYYLMQRVKQKNFAFVDAQVPTPHLQGLGGIVIPRHEFLEKLEQEVSLDVIW